MLRSIVSRNPVFTRGFRTFAPALVQAGQAVPTAPVHENSPGNSVNLAAETANGKSIIVGVPGAFSPACSASHAPGYIKLSKEFQDKGISNIFIVAVNDAFVTKAWNDQLGNDPEVSHVRFVADASGDFSKEFGSLVDEASKFFGNARTQRFAAVVEDGKVKIAFVESDNFGLDVSRAENVVKSL
ncbi:hypothetical protein DV113_000695 [Geotrichum candidum]|uniref:Similar to Saccharomyces cerevisiae YLR109W AHP1 Thiol-specific peroxiredoxin n=1 Tax=Geotrichum candidum TaxID=1173061 RepID=A0A0J9X365_GEOCN|nr:hypothetical protein DV113_000695 [Geotrichum candidum]KAI8134309.1 hypothetical protein DUD61_002032 [Geotrichum candidum]CDO51136.1 similar to Saccharomyces cerevisiae YLR109W AHP1 Thiol-specific peroxiredoxin [Geotrichum candidum]